MPIQTELSRRGFLQVTGSAAAGLTLGFHVPALIRGAAAGGAAPAVLNAWVRITPDDTVTLLLSQSEMGQGVYTSLPMILAEELECDWQKVRIEMAPVGEAYQNPAFHMQGTGGSTSVRAFMQPLRQAGAAAREMLKLAAAKRWGVPVAECHASGGGIVHGPKGQIARYGQLAAAAAALKPPAEPPLKSADQFRLIGQPVARLDLPDKVRGTATFGIDVRLPGMVYATIRQSPVFGGKVQSIANRAEVESRRGVLAVVPLDDAVAVVAEHFWQAKTAADALDVAWAEGAGAGVDDAAIMALFRSRIDGDGGGRGGARRRRPGARRRGQGGRGRIRAAVPGARHHGADERDRARHARRGWRSGRRPRARGRSPARWRRSTSCRPRRSRFTPRSSAAASAGGSSSTSRSRRQPCPRRSAGRCS